MKENEQDESGSIISSSLECISTLYPAMEIRRNSNDDSVLSNSSSSRQKDERKFQNGTIVWHCTWSHDGRYLAVSCDNQVCIYFMGSTCFLVETLSGGHERTVRYMEFAPPAAMMDDDDQHYVLATASFDGTVAIWESSSNVHNNNNSHNNLEWELTAQLEGHESEVKCVTWNSTGTLLASCGRDKSIWIWECFLSGSIGALNEEEGEFECLSVLSEGHEGDIKHVEFCPSHGQFGDGDDILLSSSYDNTIRCWAEDDGEWYCAAILDKTVHSDTIWSFSIASGIRMVSAGADGCLAIWRFYTSKERNHFEQQNKKKDDTNNPNKLEETNHSDGIWNCVGRLPDAHNYCKDPVTTVKMTNQQDESLFPVSTIQPIYSVHCAPARVGHGRIASSCGDNSIQIYREVLGGTADRPFFVVDVNVQNAHDNADVNCIRWHPQNGKLLATTGDDGAVKIWKYQNE